MNNFFVYLIISIFACNLSIFALNTENDIEGEIENCSVTEPVFDHKFTFNELKSEFGHFIDGTDDERGHYTFNICKNLSKLCSNQTAAACLRHRNGSETVIGFTSKLLWNNGRIGFSYEGEKCDEKHNYTTHVMLHCDYAHTKNDYLGVIHSDKCEINIVMRTPTACLPVPDNLSAVKMTVKTQSNETLDFTRLKSSNHRATGTGKSSSFYISFPLMYTHDILCEGGSSVCFIDNNEKDPKKRYRNVGMMTSDIHMSNGEAVLKLSSNEQCDKNKKWSSEITFACDDFTGDGAPKYRGAVDCVHKFQWETTYACAKERPCQISTDDGRFYDFSSLAGVTYKAAIPNKTNEAIYFSICSPAKEPCDSQWGGCIVKTKDDGSTQQTSTGIFTSKLSVEKKNVFLKYDNGAICNKAGRKLSTKIEFILADDKSDEAVVLVEDECDIVIQFKTLLAASYVKNCVTKNTDTDEEVDLRRLINFDGNYIADVNEKILPGETSAHNVQYLLNVCRPLNSKYSLNCHGNTAVCRTVIKDEKHEEELSLGHFEYIMRAYKLKDDDTNHVEMKYLHGSKCPTDNTEDIITSILFYCDERAGLGNPILHTIESCLYSFDFKTNILCNDQKLNFKRSTCEVTNEKLNVSVDLKAFGTFATNKNVGNIDICDGSEKNFTINYKRSMVVIEYRSSDKGIDIEVQLKCGANNNTQVEYSQNAVLLLNESSVICRLFNITPQVRKMSGSDKDNSSISESATDKDAKSGGFSLGYLVLVFIIMFGFVALYLVFRHPERREIIRNMIKFRGRRNVRYTRVHLNEDSSLLLDNNASANSVASDSDDDNILL